MFHGTVLHVAVSKNISGTIVMIFYFQYQFRTNFELFSSSSSTLELTRFR